MHITISQKEIEETLGLIIPAKDKGDFNTWKIWASIAKSVALQQLSLLRAKIAGSNHPKTSWIKEHNHIRNLVRKITIIAGGQIHNWVVDEDDKGFMFDPIRPAIYAQSQLFMQTPRVVLASATIRPKTMYMLGVKKEDFNFHEFSSDFDPARCPVYFHPVMRIDASTAHDLSAVWNKLNHFIRIRNVKGICHTISYDRQAELLATSRYQERIMVNPRGEPPTETIEQFKNSKIGTILVSPSVGTGYDFPGDECRFQFIAKIPFSPPSKIVKAREQLDKEYRSYLAMQYLDQSSGRGMRSKSDWCETIIFDEHMKWFMPRFSHLASPAFLKRIKTVNMLPKPLQF